MADTWVASTDGSMIDGGLDQNLHGPQVVIDGIPDATKVFTTASAMYPFLQVRKNSQWKKKIERTKIISCKVDMGEILAVKQVDVTFDVLPAFTVGVFLDSTVDMGAGFAGAYMGDETANKVLTQTATPSGATLSYDWFSGWFSPQEGRYVVAQVDDPSAQILKIVKMDIILSEKGRETYVPYT